MHLLRIIRCRLRFLRSMFRYRYGSAASGHFDWSSTVPLALNSSTNLACAYISRVFRGECIWEYAPVAIEALARLLAADAFAHGELMGLIDDSQEPGGLGAAINRHDGYDYRAAP